MDTIVSLFRSVASGVMALVMDLNCRRDTVKIQLGFIDCPTVQTICIGDVMYDCQHRESHAPLHGCTASAQRQTVAVEPRMQYEAPGQEREEDWRRSLRSLQECICELLIRNQELRMSLLDSVTNKQSWKADQ
jgi:hypothetical protein